MTLVFITNFINHHQIHLADELYKILGDGYKFIATEPIPESFINNGYPVFEREYLIKAYESESQLLISYNLAESSDVVIFGSGDFNIIKKRLVLNKLTFIYSERIYKNWRECIKYPYHLIKFRRRYGKSSALYLLSASAFAARDYNILGLFRNRAFKWGYFTKVNNYNDEIRDHTLTTSEYITKIMWCARFLKWKHPELPILLATRLKKEGYKFVIDMFGSGEELENTKKLAKKLCVEDVVNFCGNRPNDEVLVEMRKHDIFLFTSDKNEGWGAVLNEAMSCGCAVVAGNKIGSVPFLIQDGVNGLVFRSGNILSLYQKVVCLLDNPVFCKEIAHKAVDVINNLWSPRNAAKSLYTIINDINNSRNISIVEGPGSLV